MFSRPTSIRSEIMATDPNNDFPSDDELTNILLSEEPTRQVKDPFSQKNPDIDLSHLGRKKPVKLKRLNKKPKNLKKSKNVTDDTKKPRGRPLQWTPEKKEAELKKRKAKSAEKREQLKELAQLTKLSLNQSFGPAERQRIATTAKQVKEKVQNEIVLQRETQQKIQDVTNFTPICEHEDKFTHSDDKGYFVSACIHCSRSKEWDPREWNMYWMGVLKRRKK